MGYIVFGDDDRMKLVRGMLIAEECDGITCVFAPNVILGKAELGRVPWGATVFCGGVDNEYRASATHKMLTIRRYSDDDGFVLKNAELTAEGTIALLLSKIKSQLGTNRILLIGMGRCGRAIAKYLYALNADFVAMTARPQNVAQYKTAAYGDDVSDYDVIINTAPARVISDLQLETVKKTCIILDIASKPYGLDHFVARELGLDSDVYPAIPNIYRAESAAAAVYELVKGGNYE